MSVVGFDIGSENSYIATVKSGGIEILDNEYSLRSTPTYIAFTESSREIGVSAKAQVITNLENTIFGLKKILGKKFEDSEFQSELPYLPHEILKMDSGEIGIKVRYLGSDLVLSVEQLLAMMLTKLKIISKDKLGNTIRDCVIAVPIYYTDAQRRAMLDCVNIAGLNALKLINESAAVALTFGFFKQNLSEEPQNIVFVDLGNSCLTVTACAFTKDKGKILGCLWDDVGGRDFDNKLVQYFVNDFKIRYQFDAMTCKKAIMTLMLECEKLKKQMSTNSLEVDLQMEYFMEGQDVTGRMKREIFEKLSGDILIRIENDLRGILVQTQLSSDDIHSVEIVGGSSRIPAVKQLIQKVFCREPNSTLNQDEAVARGCALQCALLSPLLKTKKFVVEDMPSYAIRFVWLNVESRDEELEVFSFSDKVPARKGVTIKMRRPFSLEVRSVHFRGNAKKIGTFTFGNIPQSAEYKEVVEISIKACLNIHGIFSLESVHMIGKSVVETENMIEATNKSDAEKIIDKPTTEDEGGNISPNKNEQAKPGSILKLYELTINSDVPGLSRTKLKEYSDMEQQMICRDIEEKQKADVRNTLEEHVYLARGLLSYDLYNFVSDSDRTRLFQYLNDTENWLYNNEEMDASEYSKRTQEVKSCIEPIRQRSAEWKKRLAAIDEYKQFLQNALDSVSNLASANSSIDFSNEIENLLKMCENSKSYLDQSTEFFATLKKYDDVPQNYTIEELKKSLMEFQNEFQKHFSDLMKKIECSKDKAFQAFFGDGVCQDVKPSDQDKDSKASMKEETVDKSSTIKME